MQIHYHFGDFIDLKKKNEFHSETNSLMIVKDRLMKKDRVIFFISFVGMVLFFAIDIYYVKKFTTDARNSTYSLSLDWDCFLISN
jgi:hypothetical protein